MSLLNQNNLKVKVACSDNESKPELNGVFISPNESCATNSVILIKCTTIKGLDNDYPKMPDGKRPLENFKPFILPENKCEEVLKIFKKSKNLPVLNYAGVFKSNGKEAEIATTDLESFQSVTSRVTENRFPDYKELFKPEKGYADIKVNTKFLRDIASYFAGLESKFNEITISFPINGSKPIKFACKGKENLAEALLMPMREI